MRVTGAANKFPELTPPSDIAERVSMPQPDFLFLNYRFIIDPYFGPGHGLCMPRRQSSSGSQQGRQSAPSESSFEDSFTSMTCAASG